VSDIREHLTADDLRELARIYKVRAEELTTSATMLDQVAAYMEDDEARIATESRPVTKDTPLGTRVRAIRDATPNGLTWDVPEGSLGELRQWDDDFGGSIEVLFDEPVGPHGSTVSWWMLAEDFEKMKAAK
jgi:hypothetical protein